MARILWNMFSCKKISFFTFLHGMWKTKSKNEKDTGIGNYLMQRPEANKETFFW